MCAAAAAGAGAGAVACVSVCGQVDLVAVDSVAALLPRTELEGTIGDQTVRQGCGLLR